MFPISFPPFLPFPSLKLSCVGPCHFDLPKILPTRAISISLVYTLGFLFASHPSPHTPHSTTRKDEIMYVRFGVIIHYPMGIYKDISISIPSPWQGQRYMRLKSDAVVIRLHIGQSFDSRQRSQHSRQHVCQHWVETVGSVYGSRQILHVGTGLDGSYTLTVRRGGGEDDGGNSQGGNLMMDISLEVSRALKPPRSQHSSLTPCSYSWTSMQTRRPPL